MFHDVTYQMLLAELLDWFAASQPPAEFYSVLGVNIWFYLHLSFNTHLYSNFGVISLAAGLQDSVRSFLSSSLMSVLLASK